MRKCHANRGTTPSMQRLKCKEELDNYAAETAQQVTIIHNKSQAELAIGKDDFEKNMGTLDRQVTSLKREWKSFKERQEGVLAEAMDDLKAVKA